MKVDRFYFSSSIEHKVNDIISPGNWGKQYESYDPKKTPPGNWLMLARDLLFEKIRIEYFKDKPSRLKCAFLFETLLESNTFLTKCNRLNERQYEVELIDPLSPSHVGDYTLCCWKDDCTYKDMEKIAADYWVGQNIVGREFLTLSAFKITNII